MMAWPMLLSIYGIEEVGIWRCDMIVTKAVAAIAMTSLGSLAAGTAAYYEANPRAPTQYVPYVPYVPKAQPPPVAEKPAPAPVVAAQPVSDVLAIDPVVITARERRPPKALAKPSRTIVGPCSDWQAMTTGPADRKVRMLCPR